MKFERLEGFELCLNNYCVELSNPFDHNEIREAVDLLRETIKPELTVVK